MMDHESRSNDKFRQKLQQKWIDEARSAVGPVPVGADKLWQRIDQGLTRENRSVAREKPHGLHLSPRHWAMLGAAALAFLLVMSRGFIEVSSPRSNPIALTPMASEEAAPAPLETLISTHHEQLQTPSRWDAPRCDQTKQSCLFMAFL